MGPLQIFYGLLALAAAASASYGVGYYRGRSGPPPVTVAEAPAAPAPETAGTSGSTAPPRDASASGSGDAGPPPPSPAPTPEPPEPAPARTASPPAAPPVQTAAAPPVAVPPASVTGPHPLPEILFNSGSSKLTPGASRRAESAAEALKQLRLDGKLKSVKVIGHTDTVGKPALNERLSRARADQVAQRLIEAGIEKAVIAVIGSGKSNLPQATADQVAEPLNRCVGIVAVAENGTNPAGGE